MANNSVNKYYCKFPCGRLYPYTSPGTLNPSFTRRNTSVHGDTVTFYVREGIKLSDTMIHLLNIHHKPPPPPNEGDEISRSD